MTYPDRLTQYNNNYQQQIPYGHQIQTTMLNGQMVDGIDTVKAKDVDISGSPVYYPKTDGTEIYKKQLQVDGKSKIFTYRLVNESDHTSNEQSNGIIDKLNEISDRLSDIENNLLPTQMLVTTDTISNHQSGGK